MHRNEQQNGQKQQKQKQENEQGQNDETDYFRDLVVHYKTQRAKLEMMCFYTGKKLIEARSAGDHGQFLILIQLRKLKQSLRESTIHIMTALIDEVERLNNLSDKETFLNILNERIVRPLK